MRLRLRPCVPIPTVLAMADIPSRFRRFAIEGTDVEAVVQRVGLRTWDCLLVDVEGRWERAIFSTKEEAAAACSELGMRIHDGWDDPRIVQRMNRMDHWADPGGQPRAV